MATAAGCRDRWLWIFFFFFSVVGSCIVRHNERWEEGGRDGRSGRGTAAVFYFFSLPVPAGGKCLCRSSVTIPEVKVTRIKNSFSSEWEVSRGLPESGGVQRGCNYLPRCEQPLLHDVFFGVVFVGPDCK